MGQPAALLKIDLGRIEYGKALEIQRRTAEARREGAVPDALILCEHDPVVTCGRRTRKEDLGAVRAPVVWIDRGGEATYHGPGQVVGYPILALSGVGSVGRYLRGIEEVLIAVLSSFGLPAKRGPQTGVWVAGKKIVSIGISVRRGITQHGFALNVGTDLAEFRQIRPCGLDPETLSSMEAILGEPVELRAVKERIWEEFSVWHAGSRSAEPVRLAAL